jgi:hypothetical protein
MSWDAIGCVADSASKKAAFKRIADGRQRDALIARRGP